MFTQRNMPDQPEEQTKPLSPVGEQKAQKKAEQKEEHKEGAKVQSVVSSAKEVEKRPVCRT